MHGAHFGPSSICLAKNRLPIVIGAKLNPVVKLFLTANVLLEPNEAGLRARAIPLIRIGYTF